MSKEQLEGLLKVDLTKDRPYKCVDYVKIHIENIRKSTDCGYIESELELMLDDLDDIEYQFGLHVTKKYHKEKMIAKNIEIESLKDALNESIHERVHLINELEKAENHLRDIAPNELKDDLYVYKWNKYMEG